MKTLLLAALAAATVAATSCCRTGANTPPAYIEVTGKAEQEVEPDIFYLSISLSESNSTSRDNISAMEKRMIEAIKSAGADTQNDLSVTGMSGDNWYWWHRSRTVYQNKSYLLKAVNLDVLNRACDKLDSMGHVNYYLQKAEFSAIDSLKKEVQQQAVRQARAKADNLLGGERCTAGRLIFLQEREADATPPYRGQYEYDANKMEIDEAPEVGFRKLKVSYDIVARFEIE